MKNSLILTLAGALAVTSACAERIVEPTLSMFSPSQMKADVVFLADDTMLGRDTGSKEYEIAANYVAARMAQMGLQPLGENGRYHQAVPLRRGNLISDSAKMTLTINGETRTLELGEDYYLWGSPIQKEAKASAELVFVGYGIHAPELGHDDLAGVDLEGKIAVFQRSAPSKFNDLAAEVKAQYGNNDRKMRHLKERGAVGHISFNSALREERMPINSFKEYLEAKSMNWVPEVSAQAMDYYGESKLSHAVLKDIFAATDQDFTKVLEQLLNDDYETGPLKASVSLEYKNEHEPIFTSSNIVGVLEGSDPDLKDEYVVISAHLDHVGVGPREVDGDKINNGALDNAGGIATMLEVASVYQKSGVKPKRSVMFLAITAEEKGLLGADYFANFPTVEKSKIIANVNLDMPILLYDFVDVVAFGANHSDLGRTVEEAVSRIGVTLSPDPMPQQGIFTRSDHYAFVKQGVPAVMLMTGFGTAPDGKSGRKLFTNFLRAIYHGPTDDLAQRIDYQAGAKFAYVNWLIANQIANSQYLPKWNKGDFFGREYAGQE